MANRQKHPPRTDYQYTRRREVDVESPPHELTPITDISGMVVAVGSIKQDLQEMKPQFRELRDSVRADLDEIKPQIRELRDGVITLGVQRRADADRLSKIEASAESAHSCKQEETISRHSKGLRELALDHRTFEGKVAATDKEVERVSVEVTTGKKDRFKIRLALIGVFAMLMVAIAGSVGGWVWRLGTVSAQVKNIESNQEKLHNDVRSIRGEVQTVEEDVVRGLKEAINEAVRNNGGGNGDTRPRFEDWYKGLSPGEKRQLRRVVKGRGLPEDT